jgi:hypothetical protein
MGDGLYRGLPVIQALRKGIQPEFEVYDAALWNSIFPLSEQSVAETANGQVSRFYRGAWKTARPLGVDTLFNLDEQDY